MATGRRYISAMPDKIVDVFLRDVLVVSYQLPYGLVNTPLFEQDFIDRARDRMRVDGYAEGEIADAKFVVRDP